ncbi:hypothetical protein ASG90_06730 [Nocardioides sp. Soil797]|nr:hypothetical protein ASG90_06730 [Nocardioides sp. Soil797]
MNEHEHDNQRHPFWTVMSIFDPDGQGGDFAYTVGLAERGLPELHMWARPTSGHDPGDDWKFSMRDSGQILNGLAWRLLDGELAVGDTWSEQYDANLVTADFRVDPPEPAESLEAYQAGDVSVLPIRWSLERPPAGPLLQMAADARAEAEDEYARLFSIFGRFAQLPKGWELSPVADWSPHGLFGPRTPLVRARAGFMFAADGPALIGMVSKLLAVRAHDSLSFGATIANTDARPLGRVAAMHAIEEAAHHVADEFAITWGEPQGVDELLAWMAVHPGEREEALAEVRHLLGEGLHMFLAVEAVRDACDPALLVRGHGPVMQGYIGNGLPPTDAWVAYETVTAELRRVVAQRSESELAAAALAWRVASGGVIDELAMKVDALAATTASMAPHLNDWLSGEAIDTIHERLQAEGHGVALAQEWGTAFCVLLSHRRRFAEEEVAAFAEISAVGVPGLETVLNRPLDPPARRAV